MFAKTVFTLFLTLPLILASEELEYISRMITPDLAVNCTRLRLPTNLCSTCPMKSFDKEGNFNQRLDAFELSSPQCQKSMRKYVRLNPCDTVRARQMANQDDKDEARGLEIFMYAVCETCCDCIPIGSRVREYNSRKKAKTLLTPFRGNCVMHYLFDTCKILPDVADVGRSSERNFLGERKPVCEMIEDWRRRGFGREWQLDPKVDELPLGVKKYLARMTRFMGCKKRSIWKSCIGMERARGRV